MTAEQRLVRGIISRTAARASFARIQGGQRSQLRTDFGNVGKVSQVVMALWDLCVEQKGIQSPLQY